MSGGYVSTDLKAMIDFRNHLVRFNRTLDTEYRSMVGDWKRLGGVWRDQKYSEFGDELAEVGRASSATSRSPTSTRPTCAS